MTRPRTAFILPLCIIGLAETLAGKSSAKFARRGIQDKFGCSGKPADLFAAYGLTTADIVATCESLIKK